MTVKLSIICSKQSNGTYFAICPEIKGCFTQGDTYEDASSNIKDLANAMIKDEYAKEAIQDILLSQNKIYSEFEIAI